MTTRAAPVVIRLGEWESREIAGLTLSADDLALVGTLAESNRIVIDELKSGLRISTRSWVGVIRCSSFELHILPKLAGENLGLVKLLDFVNGLDCLKRYPDVQQLSEGDQGLFDLIALLHAEACGQVARGGLLADYQEAEDDLPVVRGRLLVERQCVKGGQVNRIRCRFDERTNNVPDNQILLAALEASARHVKNTAILIRIRRMLGLFSAVCSLDGVDMGEARAGLYYHRTNEHYQTPHGLAGMLLDGLSAHEFFRGGEVRCFAFLIDMNRLFELFAYRWFSRLLAGTGFQITYQRHGSGILWNADTNQPHAHVRPDLLIRTTNRSGPCLPVDAKYKLYDKRDLALTDVYQLFLYAFAWASGDKSVIPIALLLYPATSPTSGHLRLHIRNWAGETGAEVLSIGVHIPTALEEAVSKRQGAFGREIVKRITSAIP